MYVELRNIEKSFGSFQASRGVSFGVEEGQLAALLGPSGSGKTTLLRMIAGLDSPDSGEILIGGRVVNDIPGSQRGIGFVFQSYALFRYMTVYDNIAFGLEVQKRPRGEIRRRVEELMDLTGLAGLGKRYPGQLSGGQRQRVAFARALAPNPRLLLLDEPFAAIDAKVRQELRLWLKSTIAELGITSIFVTHDQAEALEVADTIIVTDQGRVEQIGAPADIYLRPETAFVTRFVGNSPVVSKWSFLGFPKTAADSLAVIRPEFIEAFKPDNQKFAGLMDAAETGVVEDVAFKGSHYELTLRVGDAVLTVRRSLARRPVTRGEVLKVLIYRLYELVGDRVLLRENALLAGRDIPDD